MDIQLKGKTAFLENRRTTESLAKDPNSEIVTGYPGYRTDGLLSNRKSLKVPNKIHPDNPTGKKHFLPWVTILQTVWMAVHGDSFQKMK